MSGNSGASTWICPTKLVCRPISLLYLYCESCGGGGSLCDSGCWGQVELDIFIGQSQDPGSLLCLMAGPATAGVPAEFHLLPWHGTRLDIGHIVTDNHVNIETWSAHHFNIIFNLNNQKCHIYLHNYTFIQNQNIHYHRKENRTPSKFLIVPLMERWLKDPPQLRPWWQ